MLNPSLRRFSTRFTHELKNRSKKLFAEQLKPSMSAKDAVNNILYNTPSASPMPVTRHIINLLCSNEPGVLSRVCGVLAARGFNIDSLVVSRTEVPDLSRMTIALQGQASVIEQVKKQMEDLVPVWAVLDYTHGKIIERELLLVKVWTVPTEHLTEDYSSEGVNERGLSPLLAASVQRQALTDLARLFHAKIVDVSMDSMIIELSAKTSRVDAFLKLLQPYGIIEATRTGCMALPRDTFGLDEDEHDPVQENDSPMDPSLLPPS